MAFVIDPDSLNRFDVAVDPIGERVSIRGLGTERVAKATTGETAVSTTFTDSTKDFGTLGVVEGDILTIVNKDDIGHHVVATAGTTTLTVTVAFTTANTTLTYKINAPKATGGTDPNIADGVTLQALYSFLKEEWRTYDTGIFGAGEAPDLINYIFPLESITREQFEIGGLTHGGWDFKDDTTRNLIRTGGWKQINSGGTTIKEFAGVITLGALDTDAQVYYLQTSGAGVPVNFVLPGVVNQAIQTWVSGTDDRTALNLYVRKKGRTYAGSAIADIGVTTIEPIVNRFPLAHVDDPAIVVSDGVLKGDGVAGNVAFQQVATVDDAKTDGAITDPTTTDGQFQLISAASLFLTTNKVSPGDTVELTGGSDLGVYEIKTVDDETTLQLFQEPGVAIAGGTGVAFTTRSRVRNYGATDGTTADATPDDGLGEFTSTTVGNFATAGVVVGDMLEITAATTAANIGIYKITVVATTTLTANIQDNENWAAEAGATFRILRKGMHLQYRKKTITLGATGDLTFANANPDTIARTSGSWITDTVKVGDTIAITGSVNNNGSYTVAVVTSATVITLVATDTLTAEGPVAATATCSRGIVRTLNDVAYGFNWRMFGNAGTLAECFQWIQRELRRATDIDDATSSSRGDITALLQAFASPNTVTINLVIDNVAAADLNNLTQGDTTAVNRNDAFLTSITVSLNSNINNSNSKKLNVYWTDSPNQFGTVNAVLVEDKDAANMTASDTELDGSTVVFTYNYDATQNGHGGVDENVTIVCIGKTAAQYVKATGTITRKNENTFSMVAPLERNYQT